MARSELDPDSGAGLACLADGERGGGQILDRDAERLEHRNLPGIRPAWCAADQELADLSPDVVRLDRAFG